MEAITEEQIKLVEGQDFSPLLQEMLDAGTQRAKEFETNVQTFVGNLLAEEAFSLFDKRRAAVVRKWKHSSYYDLVLTHGTVRMAPVRSDDILGVMPARQCYRNAYDAIVEYGDYTYVEGYAQTQFLAVQHAWLEDRDGNIVDPTWANLDLPAGFRATYAGIKFTSDFVMARVLANGWHSMLAADWQKSHETLQRGLKINDAGHAYDLGDLTS